MYFILCPRGTRPRSHRAPRVHEALRLIWEEIAELNQGIDTTRPWESLKNGKEKELHSILDTWVEGIRQIGCGLGPFLPETAEQIEERFSREIISVGGILFPRVVSALE